MRPPDACPYCACQTPDPGPGAAACPGCRRALVASRDPRTRGPESWFPADLGRYRLTAFVGGGGMGRVFRGRDAVTGRDVAVKFPAADGGWDAAARERFGREIKALRALDHPNVVRFLDGGDEAGRPYFVMEWVEGVDLARVMAECRAGGGCLPFAVVHPWFQQLCRALQTLHDAGVVHRDVKPANVMRAADGTIRLIDLGVAKLQDAGAGATTLATGAVGTSAYMAPEQWASQAVDGRADVYAAGMVVYELLTGLLPRGNVRRPSEINGTVPVWFDSVVMSMMEPEPCARPACFSIWAAEERPDRPAPAPVPMAAASRGLVKPVVRTLLPSTPKDPASPQAGVLRGANADATPHPQSATTQATREDVEEEARSVLANVVTCGRRVGGAAALVPVALGFISLWVWGNCNWLGRPGDQLSILLLTPLFAYGAAYAATKAIVERNAFKGFFSDRSLLADKVKERIRRGGVRPPDRLPPWPPKAWTWPAIATGSALAVAVCSQITAIPAERERVKARLAAEGQVLFCHISVSAREGLATGSNILILKNNNDVQQVEVAPGKSQLVQPGALSNCDLTMTVFLDTGVVLPLRLHWDRWQVGEAKTINFPDHSKVERLQIEGTVWNADGRDGRYVNVSYVFHPDQH